MSYRDGVAVLLGGESGVGLIPGFTSPDGALDHLNEIARAFDVLELDMRNGAGAMTPANLAAYELLKDEWRPFYQESQGYTARFLGGNEIDDRCGVFATKIIAFRDLLQKKGAAVSGPPPEKPPPPLLDRVANAATGGSGYAKAAVVIAGLLAAGYFIKQARGVLP